MAWKQANQRSGFLKRSDRAAKSAARRQCPACNRKGALSRLPAEFETFDGLFRAKPIMLECRFCQWTGTFAEKNELLRSGSSDRTQA